jgi:hypothetical protein
MIKFQQNWILHSEIHKLIHFFSEIRLTATVMEGLALFIITKENNGDRNIFREIPVEGLSYGLDDRGCLPARAGIFLFATILSRPALEPTQSALKWIPRTLSQGIERPEHEAGHSPPPSAEVKNALKLTSILPYIFMAWCLN